MTEEQRPGRALEGRRTFLVQLGAVVALVSARASIAEASLAQEGERLRRSTPQLATGRVVASGSSESAYACGLVDAPLSGVLAGLLGGAQFARVVPGVESARVLSSSRGQRRVAMTLRTGRRLTGEVRIDGHGDGTHSLALTLDQGLGTARIVLARSPGGRRTLAGVRLALANDLLPIGPARRHLRNGAIGTVARLRRLVRAQPARAARTSPRGTCPALG